MQNEDDDNVPVIQFDWLNLGLNGHHTKDPRANVKMSASCWAIVDDFALRFTMKKIEVLESLIIAWGKLSDKAKLAALTLDKGDRNHVIVKMRQACHAIVDDFALRHNLNNCDVLDAMVFTWGGLDDTQKMKALVRSRQKRR